MAWAVLGLFCASLVACIAAGLSLLWALVFGLVLFLLYGRTRGLSWRRLFTLALEGVKAVKTILLTFLLIGVLTALWRAAGTISLIVAWAGALIRPAVFLPACFLLCCGVSLLTGTSFGTAATIGVICAAMGATIGVDARLTGGAVLAGAFFGDRCSPVSTSALLVSELTKTDIYDNIRRMLRTALVPFLLSVAVYFALGLFTGGTGETPDLRALFSGEFSLHPLAVLPAAVILVMAALRVKVKAAMAVSILSAVPLALFLQHMPPLELLRAALLGWRAADSAVGALLNGGGVVSMLRAAGIVCLSASYSGIFRETGLLDGAKRLISGVAARSSLYTGTLAASLAAGGVACNQTLAIMLTEQLSRSEYTDDSARALDLEDSAVVTSPLIPWSIACAVPLSAVGAPAGAVLSACYLYFLPLWRLAQDGIRKKKTDSRATAGF